MSTAGAFNVFLDTLNDALESSKAEPSGPRQLRAATSSTRTSTRKSAPRKSSSKKSTSSKTSSRSTSTRRAS